jgi:hypothetical protein
MSKSNSKKKRGRPRTTGQGILVGVRLQPDQLSAIDALAKDGHGTRQEAIRKLIKRAIGTPAAAITDELTSVLNRIHAAETGLIGMTAESPKHELWLQRARCALHTLRTGLQKFELIQETKSSKDAKRRLRLKDELRRTDRLLFAIHVDRISE